MSKVTITKRQLNRLRKIDKAVAYSLPWGVRQVGPTTYICTSCGADMGTPSTAKHDSDCEWEALREAWSNHA